MKNVPTHMHSFRNADAIQPAAEFSKPPPAGFVSTRDRAADSRDRFDRDKDRSDKDRERFDRETRFSTRDPTLVRPTPFKKQ
jgi:hypothetical protein